jgi:hypothetical protein
MGALIAAAGITAAGAVAGGAMSMSAAGSAARATGKASKSQKKALKQANEQYERSLNEYNRKQNEVRAAISKIDPNIKIETYNLEGATQEAINAANEATENTITQLRRLIDQNPTDIFKRGLAEARGWQQRLVNQYQRIEGAYPLLEEAAAGITRGEETLGLAQAGLGRAEEKLGTAEQRLGVAEYELGIPRQTLEAQLPQLQRAREIISQLSEGELTERQRKQLAQVNAELVGATYNPQAARRTAGFQIGQAQLLEATRQAAEERQRYGLSMVPSITQQTSAIAGQQADLATRRAAMAGQLAGIGMDRGQLAGQMANIGMGYGQLAGQRAGLTADYARLAGTQAQLGEAARGWQNTTMAWMDLGRSWQQPVVPMMQMAAQGRQQDIGVQEANILNQMRQQAAIGGINLGELQAAQSRYAAATGQAQQNYDIAQRGIQADLALGQSRAQMVTEGTAAIGTALSAGAGAYNQYATARAAGGGGGYAGGFDYSKVYGPATYGTSTPGFGNFDYGLGTGA